MKRPQTSDPPATANGMTMVMVLPAKSVLFAGALPMTSAHAAKPTNKVWRFMRLLPPFSHRRDDLRHLGRTPQAPQPAIISAVASGTAASPSIVVEQA